MILATSTPRLERSAYPFAPLKSTLIPSRQTTAAIDYTYARTGVDNDQAWRIMADLEQRAEQDLDHLMSKAMTYAGALGKIDALHIEWGSTKLDEADAVRLWERLGAILREAGIQ